jgi:hypothetical protein
LAAFTWHRVEALDAKGNVVGVFENADVEEEVLLDGTPTERTGEVGALLGLMLKAQDVALRRHSEHTRELLDQAVEMMRVYTSRLTALETLAHQMLDRKLADAAQPVRAGDGLEEMLIPAVLAKLGGGGDEAAMEAMMERVAGKVLPRVLSPGSAAGTPPGGNASAGKPGTGPNGQSTPGK